MFEMASRPNPVLEVILVCTDGVFVEIPVLNYQR